MYMYTHIRASLAERVRGLKGEHLTLSRHANLRWLFFSFKNRKIHEKRKKKRKKKHLRAFLHAGTCGVHIVQISYPPQQGRGGRRPRTL